MKLNNKGFAISSIMYLILIMAVLLILVTLSLLGNRKLVLDKLKDSIKGEIYTELAEEQFNRLYERLDYIESTGTQYIDTGVVPTDTTGVKIDIMTTTKLTDQVFFGSRTTTDGRFWVGKTTTIYYGWNSNNYSSSGNNDMYLNSIKLNYLNDKLATVNDSDTYTISSTLESNTKSVYVFAGNDNGTAKYFSQIRVYDFQITQDSKVVRDLVPCYRKSDRTVGMYDKINGVFYTNSGTGNFIPGPTSTFVNEYQEVDYIESTGTQWIDTNYTMSANSFWATIDVNYTNPTSEQAVLGINTKVEVYSDATPNINIWVKNDSATTTKATAGATSKNTWQRVRAQYESEYAAISIDGGTVSSSKLASVSLNVSPITLLAYSSSGSYASSAKLRAAKIWDTSGLVRNYIPCYRKSDNVIGLYDTIEGKFYTNSGTGTFGKGRDIDK